MIPTEELFELADAAGKILADLQDGDAEEQPIAVNRPRPA